jgi:hypothetical protein
MMKQVQALRMKAQLEPSQILKQRQRELVLTIPNR